MNLILLCFSNKLDKLTGSLGLVSLRRLEVNHNQLKCIPDGFLSACPKLEVLEAAFNEIGTVQSNRLYIIHSRYGLYESNGGPSDIDLLWIKMIQSTVYIDIPRSLVKKCFKFKRNRNFSLHFYLFYAALKNTAFIWRHLAFWGIQLLLHDCTEYKCYSPLQSVGISIAVKIIYSTIFDIAWLWIWCV